MAAAPAPHPLRRWRARNRWPGARLAQAIGTTGATVSRIEAGQQFPRPELLTRLIGLTGIPAERFLARRGGAAQLPGSAGPAQAVNAETGETDG